MPLDTNITTTIQHNQVTQEWRFGHKLMELYPLATSEHHVTELLKNDSGLC